MPVLLALRQPLSPHITVNPRKTHGDEHTPATSAWAIHKRLAFGPTHRRLDSGRLPLQQHREAVKKGHVRFPPSVQVREGLHYNDYTEEEKQASWYSEEELSAMSSARRMLMSLWDQQEEQRQQTQTLGDGTAGDATDAAPVLSGCDGGDDRGGLETPVAASTVRGLECKSKWGRRRRSLHVNAAVGAVIREQDFQQLRGGWGQQDGAAVEAIARICEMHTRQCVWEARQRGVSDEREVSC